MAQRLTGIRVQSYVGGTVVCEDNPTSCCSGLSPISGGGIIINSGTSVLYNNVTITINSGIIYLNGSNVYVQSGSIITYQSGVKIDNKNNIITSISVTDNRSGGSIITYYGVDTFNFVGGGQVVVNSGSYTYQGGSVNNTSGLRTTNTNTITTTQGGSISLVSATTVTNNLTVTTVQGGSVTYQSGPTITYQDATITAGGLTTATYNGTAITYNSGSNETFTLVSRTVNSGNELFKGVAIALRSGTREDVYDATFSFNSGSRLNVPAGAIALSSGGTMSVSDAGSITINSGASLILASGASLTLNGQSTGGSSYVAGYLSGSITLGSGVSVLSYAALSGQAVHGSLSIRQRTSDPSCWSLLFNTAYILSGAVSGQSTPQSGNYIVFDGNTNAGTIDFDSTLASGFAAPIISFQLLGWSNISGTAIHYDARYSLVGG